MFSGNLIGLKDCHILVSHKFVYTVGKWLFTSTFYFHILSTRFICCILAFLPSSRCCHLRSANVALTLSPAHGIFAPGPTVYASSPPTPLAWPPELLILYRVLVECVLSLIWNLRRL